jgi:hypothetical protein
MSSGSADWLPYVFLVIPGIFALVGTVFVVAGIRGIRSTNRFERSAIRVPGQCVDLKLRDHGTATQEYRSTWYPVLAFATIDGRRLTVESPWGGTPAPARPGQAVTVLYDPRQPARARVDNWKGRGTPFYVAAIVLGTLIGGLGWAILLGVGYALLT